jgi:hypothetical protein
MKVPQWVVPALIVVLTLIGLGAARLLAIPSVTLDLAEAGTAGPSRTVTLLVDGVKCVDTARTAASALEDLAGVRRFVAYASRNRVEITFNPEQIAVESLVEAVEGPLFDEETGEFLFGLYEVVEIDGRPVQKNQEE